MLDGVEMDLGACWVHSYSQKNPIQKEVAKLNWQKGKLGGSFYGRKLIDGETGE